MPPIKRQLIDKNKKFVANQFRVSLLAYPPVQPTGTTGASGLPFFMSSWNVEVVGLRKGMQKATSDDW
jgi:hypothetical protein